MVSHSIQLNEGYLGLFVLNLKSTSNKLSKSTTKKTFNLVSEAQSFYKYNLDKNSAVNAFKNIQNIDKICICNLEGKVIYHSIEKNSFRSKSIDIDHFSTSLYFVKIDNEYGLITHKLILS